MNNIDLSILIDPKFGWILIWSEIIILYSLFLVLHRIAEKRHKKKDIRKKH